jgi:tetratricopeptide (TPR) repeat protein
MGQIIEDSDDYLGAAKAYARAFTLPPGTDATWYLLHNNLGYCLNILGRHAEAEALCRGAVEIDPTRHNAFKNLGVSLQGLGRLEEAAECYRRAAKLCPEDGRAQRLLDQLRAERQD